MKAKTARLDKCPCCGAQLLESHAPWFACGSRIYFRKKPGKLAVNEVESGEEDYVLLQRLACLRAERDMLRAATEKLLRPIPIE